MVYCGDCVLSENPWTCDDHLEWFRQWLRDNADMIIDAPGYPTTVCNKPEQLFGAPIRSANSTSNGVLSSGSTVKYSPTKSTGQSKVNLHEPLHGQGQHNSDPKISGVNIMALILGKYIQKCM